MGGSRRNGIPRTLSVHAIGEWDSPDYCTFDVDANEARTLLSVMNEVRRLRRKVDGAWAICVWGSPGEYREGEPDEPADAQAQHEEFWRVVCEQAVVTQSTVYWSAQEKHTAVGFETEEVDEAVLKRIARRPAEK